MTYSSRTGSLLAAAIENGHYAMAVGLVMAAADPNGLLYAKGPQPTEDSDTPLTLLLQHWNKFENNTGAALMQVLIDQGTHTH